MIILNIVSTLLKMALISLGDKYLAKWIAAGQYWFRNLTDENLRRQVDLEYNSYHENWRKIRSDDGPYRPNKKDGD